MPASAAQACALATLYIVLVTDDCLTRLGSSGPIVIEGAFTANRHYGALLAALRPQQPVWVSQDRAGTTAGAYLLARRPEAYRSPCARVPAAHLPGWADYARRWWQRCAAITQAA